MNRTEAKIQVKRKLLTYLRLIRRDATLEEADAAIDEERRLTVEIARLEPESSPDMPSAASVVAGLPQAG